MIYNAALYEIRLREEFKNLRRLQNDANMKRILIISFIDRITGETKNIINNPSSPIYPEQYKIICRMPVFIERGNLKRDWEGEISLSIDSEILMTAETNKVPFCHLDVSHGLPFNHHISTGFFCTGGVWSVAKDYGIWYFIMGCGCIINQEAPWMDDSGAGHLNFPAYIYWKNDRQKRKINEINWPFDLRDQIEIGNKIESVLKKIKIGNPLPREEHTIKINRSTQKNGE